MKYVLALLGGLFVVGLGLPAYSQTDETGFPVQREEIHNTIHPVFGLLQRQIQAFGRAAPVFGRGLPADVRLNGAGATLRFSRELTGLEHVTLDALGVELVSKLRRRNGPIYAAWVPFSALENLPRLTPLVRAEPTWAPVTLMPLETTTALVGASQLQTPSGRPIGAGVLAHIDSGIDVQHPHFFEADGGYFRWIDVNDDGRLSAGIDAIDLNGDGEANANETVELLEAGELRRFGGTVDALDSTFQPDRDWLFVDHNLDGIRNFGRDAGFTEEDPGYGEPMFVADDVDDDGTLGLFEKVVLLSTSKIARVVEADETYVRGGNLIDALDSAFRPYSFHGTGVASIAVGGQPGFHRRVGIAPGADLEVYAFGSGLEDGFFESGLQAQYLIALQDRDVLSVLHEWTNPFTVAQDGSTNLEATMDTLAAQGKVQVTPVGNLNTADKHVEIELAAAAAEDVFFEVGPGFGRDEELLAYETVYISLFWRKDQELAVTLVDPVGSEVLLQPGSAQDIGGAALDSALDVTPRGTRHLLIVLFQDGGSLAVGQWKVRIRSVSADVLVGRITDEHSGWAPGVRWSNPTLTGTIANPSTADSALGVGAYSGRISGDEPLGSLRDFSGRGVRIDGARVVDIVAPDDPMAALAATDELVEAGVGTSWFKGFGGTSGAAPHVSAAFALLGGDDPADQLLRAANADDLGQAPNMDWGWGKLNIYRAVMGEDYESVVGEPPVAALDVFRDGEAFVLDATGSTDPEGGELEYRFDVDYDGRPDTEWGAEPRLSTNMKAAVSRVWVRDGIGLESGAVARWPKTEDMDEGADGGVDDSSPPDDCQGCATADGPLQLWWFVFILGVNWWRRRVVG